MGLLHFTGQLKGGTESTRTVRVEGNTLRLRPAKRQHECHDSNARVRLTCEEDARKAFGPTHPLHATRDPHDRAHGVRDHRDMLVPAPKVLGSKPREYPASAMTSRGVAHDSAFDELHARLCWLVKVGLLGGGSRHAVSALDVGARGAVEVLATRKGRREARRLIDENRSAFALPVGDEADRWLADHDPEYWDRHEMGGRE